MNVNKYLTMDYIFELIVPCHTFKSLPIDRQKDQLPAYINISQNRKSDVGKVNSLRSVGQCVR